MDENVKHIKMLELGDKAILSVDDEHHFLINLTEFNNSKIKFYVTKEGQVIPSNYSIWFSSYKEEKTFIKFEIETQTDAADFEYFYSGYKINGYIDKKGNVLNRFLVGQPNCSYEIYIPMQCCDNINLIVWWCMKAIVSYYEPLDPIVESKGLSKRYRFDIQ